jgi:hypothetical protein
MGELPAFLDVSSRRFPFIPPAIARGDLLSQHPVTGFGTLDFEKLRSMLATSGGRAEDE